MQKPDTHTTLKRLRSNYRLVIMNDDTFEEMIKFRLTRLSVYMVASTIFLLMIGFTVALLVLTPLKFYIPGYGKKESRTELQLLKIRTDSLQQVLEYREQYLENIKKTLGGNNTIKKDTVMLKVPKTNNSND